jgi:hypothetical protein
MNRPKYFQGGTLRIIFFVLESFAKVIYDNAKRYEKAHRQLVETGGGSHASPSPMGS